MLAACVRTPVETPADAQATCGCSRFSQPVEVGRVGQPALTELSGLAASRAHPGVWYAHNDSGDSARFFALSDTGEPLGEFILPGANAVDWEDMALGPCSSGTCVFLGDFGDNARVRTDYAIYRVPEPALMGSADVPFERLPFEYPGGEKHDAETLLVHPVTGDLYVVDKKSFGERSEVFRFPRDRDASTVATLERVAQLPLPTSSDAPITGGDIDSCGERLLLRTYTRLYLFELPTGESFEAIFSAGFKAMPVAEEFQGEAVAWRHDGRGYLTASEGSAPPLMRTTCR